MKSVDRVVGCHAYPGDSGVWGCDAGHEFEVETVMIAEGEAVEAEPG